MATAFTPAETETLRAHGIAVYRNRLILDARPPITPAELKAIEDQIGTTVPAGLLELWNISFGGRLDYDLTIPLGDFLYSASFRELFYPDSGGYHDLPGWIEHEQEGYADAAEERGEPEPTVLEALPFGGFEYLQRFYVMTQGPELGRVLIYAQGLPPAWKGRLSEDTVAPVAGSVAELFDMLELVKDPRTADPKSYPSGLEALEKIDALGEHEPALADRIEAVLNEAVFDWRAMIEGAAFSGDAKQRQAARLALMAAGEADDIELLEILLRGGYPVDDFVTGQTTALSYAVGRGATKVAKRLLESGKPLGETTILFAKGIDEELVVALIEAKVAFDIEAALTAAESGSIDAALRIIHRGKRSGDWDDVPYEIGKRRRRALESAEKIEAGKLHSYATPAEYREQARHLGMLNERL